MFYILTSTDPQTAHDSYCYKSATAYEYTSLQSTLPGQCFPGTNWILKNALKYILCT